MAFRWDHPSKGPFDNPASGQHLEALLLIAATNDRYDCAADERHLVEIAMPAEQLPPLQWHI